MTRRYYRLNKAVCRPKGRRKPGEDTDPVETIAIATSAQRADELVDALNALDSIKRTVVPMVMP